MLSHGSQPSRSILITGCSTGIGLASAKMLASRGWQVFATARKDDDLAMLNKLENVTGLYLEYRDLSSIQACVQTVSEQTGGKLYALFNNGAYGQPGALEDLKTEHLKDQFDVNVFGWHELIRLVVPIMRAQNKGRIVQCSSVLGLVSPHYRGAYNASKFAIEALSDALRLELHDTNINVSIIEPGPIQTAFLPTAMAAYQDNIEFDHSPHKEVYYQRLKKMKAGGAGRFKLEPEAVAKKLVHAVESSAPKRRYYVTIPTYIMAYGKRLLPTWALDKILLRN